MIAVGADIKVRQISMSCPQFGMVDSIDLGKPSGYRESELHQLADWVRRFHHDVRDWAYGKEIGLWIEKAFLANSAARSLNATLSLAEVSTVVRTAAPWTHVEQVVPSTWKAEVLGYGHADKEDIQAWLAVNDPELAEFCAREDEYDASCIATYGTMRLDFGLDLPERKPRGRRKATRGAAADA